MDGRRVLVTGAASGIGAAVARLMHERGAEVHLADIDVAGGEQVAEGLERATFHALDVTDESAWRSVEATVTRAGPLHVLVTSAGAASRSTVVGTPVQELRRLLDLNLTGTLLGIQAAARSMTDGGSIVTIASLRGVVATAGLGAYGVSKFGVRALSRTAAIELAPAGIRVNCVCPGSIVTPITNGPGFADDDMEAYVRSIPMRRRGAPEEVASVVAFLAGNDSSYVTGADVLVDGGMGAGVSTPTRDGRG